MNPHFFFYPTFYLYILFLVYGLYYLIFRITGFFSSINDFIALFILNPSPLHIISRSISAASGILSIYLLYLLSKKLYSKEAGLVSSLILSLTYLHAKDSHFGTTDVPLTFLILLSYLFISDILLSGKNYILAGLLSGLSASIKYNGSILAIAILTAHLLHKKDSEKNLRKKIFDKNIFLSAIAMILSFILTSPYVVLDNKAFLKSIKFITKAVGRGIGMNLDIGWLFYLKFTLRYGIGIPFLLISIIGIIYLIYSHRKEDILVLSFPLAYFIFIGNSYGVFSRYMIPLLPFLALFAGIVINKFISSLKFLRNYIPEVPILISLIILIPSIYNLINFSKILSMEDTRNLAANWVKKNIPSGSRIYIHGHEEYEIPPLPIDSENIKKELEFFNEFKWKDREMILRIQGINSLIKKKVLPLQPNFHIIRGESEYINDDILIKLSPDYIITTEYYLEYYSSDAKKLDNFLKNFCTPLKSFYPYNRAFKKPNPIFDPLDAFYVPYAKPDGIIRPGPVIHVYKVIINLNS